MSSGKACNIVEKRTNLWHNTCGMKEECVTHLLKFKIKKLAIAEKMFNKNHRSHRGHEVSRVQLFVWCMSEIWVFILHPHYRWFRKDEIFYLQEMKEEKSSEKEFKEASFHLKYRTQKQHSWSYLTLKMWYFVVTNSEHQACYVYQCLEITLTYWNFSCNNHTEVQVPI